MKRAGIEIDEAWVQEQLSHFTPADMHGPVRMMRAFERAAAERAAQERGAA